MNRSKVKTISIIALLFVNLLFISFILYDNIAERRERREELELAVSILAAEGIKVDADHIHFTENIRALRTTRDDSVEERIARAVLGSVNNVPHGVINAYESEDNGVALFYAVGDFEIMLNEGVLPISGGVIQTAERALRSMGVDAIALEIENSDEGATVVTAISAHRGVAIFNNTIDFVFNEYDLITIRGRYVTGFEQVYTYSTISSIPTVLLRILAAIRSGEIKAQSILRIEAGFQFRPAGGIGEGIVTPAWLITTDTGRYIADCETGEIRALG